MNNFTVLFIWLIYCALAIHVENYLVQPSAHSGDFEQRQEIYLFHTIQNMKMVDSLIIAYSHELEPQLSNLAKHQLWYCLNYAKDTKEKAQCAVDAMYRKISSRSNFHDFYRLQKSTSPSRLRYKRSSRLQQRKNVQKSVFVNRKAEIFNSREKNSEKLAKTTLAKVSIHKNRRNNATYFSDRFKKLSQMTKDQLNERSLKIADSFLKTPLNIDNPTLPKNLLKMFHLATGHESDQKYEYKKSFDRLLELQKRGVGINFLKEYMRWQQIFHKQQSTANPKAFMHQMVDDLAEAALQYNQSAIAFMSPQVFSIVPRDNNKIPILSPEILPLFETNETISVHKLIDLAPVSNKQDWMNLIMELSGATDIVTKIVRWYESDDRDGDERQLIAREYIRYMDTVDRTQNGLSDEEKSRFHRSGIAYFDEKDVEQMFEKRNSPFYRHPNISTFDLKQFAKLTKNEKVEIIEAKIMLIAGHEKKVNGALKSWAKRVFAISSPTVKSPGVLGPVILDPGVLSPPVLSPNALSPGILSPQVLSPIVLSPYVLSPLILSPIVLNPTVLSPYALSPEILSPNVFSPYVLSPYILSPYILCPLVASPDVISPNMLGGVILSPGVLGPSVLSPTPLSANVLSPCALCG